MAAAGRGLLFFSAAVFADGHDSRRHVCIYVGACLGASAARGV
jgi:hypothetical protein